MQNVSVYNTQILTKKNNEKMHSKRKVNMDEKYRKENNDNPKTDTIQLNVAKRNDPLHFIC